MAHEAYSIRSSRVVAEGRVGPGVVFVRGEKIERVELGDAGVRGAKASTTAPGPELDVGNLVLMPGLVDTHVHVNEPGRTDWEGFVTAGRAAAAGGITTIVVMPLNCTPAATNVAALMGEAEAAAGKCLVDYGFWGGVVPGNAGEIEPMWRAGALGFKCFMVESGVEDFAAVTSEDLGIAEGVLARLGAPLLAHAEDPGVLLHVVGMCGLAESPRSYAAYLRSRPDVSEMISVRLLWMYAGDHRSCPVHVVHVSSPSAAAFLDEGVRGNRLMTGETCPHYLTFCAEDIPDGATQFKCAPPIRRRAIRETLWELLRNRTLSMVVSDHSPCPPELKCLDTGDFSKAWGGISSLQLGLAATWTGAHTRGFSLTDIARWMCENPARLAAIDRQKGRIAAGCDADLVVFDPDAEWTVRGELLQHRHKLTPYDGMTLRGVVKKTFVRGHLVYDAMGAGGTQSARAGCPCYFSEPIGQWIKRDT